MHNNTHHLVDMTKKIHNTVDPNVIKGIVPTYERIPVGNTGVVSYGQNRFELVERTSLHEVFRYSSGDADDIISALGAILRGR